MSRLSAVMQRLWGELRAAKGRVRRQGLQALAIAAAVTAAVSGLRAVEFEPLMRSDRGGYDAALSRYTRRAERSPHVVVVAVDESTLTQVREDQELHRRLGSWPYARVVWGQVADYLAQQGARALVLDLVMDEPQLGGYDEQMAEEILRARLPVYLGFSASHAGLPLDRVTPSNLLPEEVFAAALGRGEDDPDAFGLPGLEEDLPVDRPPLDLQAAAQALAFPVGGSRAPRTLERPRFGVDGRWKILPLHPQPPVVPLWEAASGFGLVEPEEDADGVLRRTWFAYRSGENAFVTLPVAAVADLMGAKEIRLEPGALHIGERRWKLDARGAARIDFGGHPDQAFHTVSLASVLADHSALAEGAARRLPEDLFLDKVVLVGGSALGLQDVKATPFASSTPGYAKQAATLHALLGGRFITDAPFWLSVLLTFAVAAGSALLLTAFRVTALDLGWPALLYLGFGVVPGLSMKLWAVYPPWAMPVWAGLGASVGAVALARLASERKRDQLKKIFARYLDHSLVEKMAEADKLPKLEGESREITAFFSDIKGFSSFSESLKDDPRTLVMVLNTYLTRVSAVLLREGGCLDKYIGDAVVSLFGAPHPQPDHAVRACRGALAVQREVAALREEFRAQGLPDVYTRVGLNSATMFVGNFGSEQLFDYTAIGDGMNLAARLEGANKAFGSLIMIGPLTYQQARPYIEARELDRVRVAGKKQAVSVYELLCLAGELPPTKRAVVEHYARGLARYREGHFAEAAEIFAQALELDPADGPSRVLQERCLAYQQHPPAAFDGVVNLDK